MGTSSHNSNGHNGRYIKTRGHVASPRAWLDVNGGPSKVITGSRSEHYRFNTASVAQRPASARMVKAGYGTNDKSAKVCLSPRHEAHLAGNIDIISVPPVSGYNHQPNAGFNPAAGFATSRPSSAAALMFHRNHFQKPLSPSKVLPQPRPPVSGVTDRAYFPPAPSHPPQLRCTLDDLPMQHTREDALNLLEQRRAQLDARRQNLRFEGGQIRQVGNFSRRCFDMAVKSRGEGPLPAPSPDEEAALFYKAASPSWSSPEPPTHPAAARLKPRPHSVAVTQPPALTAAVAPRLRPDSEPPGRWHAGKYVPGREFNHLRNNRLMYPHIQNLVQRYNEDLKVVCNQAPAMVDRRRQSKDYSVASEYFLVPLKLDESTEEEEEKEKPEREEAKEELPGLTSDELLLQQEDKDEDQLVQEKSEIQETPRVSDQQKQQQEKEDEEEKEEREEDQELEPTPPWRCWVDDATVSTVHSRPPSEPASEDAADKLEEAELKRSALQAGHPQQEGRASLRASLLPVDSAGRPSKLVPALPAEMSPVAESPAKQSQQQQSKDKMVGGRKKRDSSLPEPPPPPPPVEEQQPLMVVEEAVEESEVEPEPEPEPVPPQYICPSSESKSHTVEIRRWLSKSPFRTAARTMPIF